mgnify:CR=1 FL=1
MQTNLLIFILILALINLTAFIFVGTDKKSSLHNSERVPEVYLFFIAIFFASLGVVLGMYFFHHKTRKIYFTLGIGLLLLEQLALLYLIAQKI